MSYKLSNERLRICLSGGNVMKSKIQNLIVVLVLVMTASSASAIFVPVPVPENKSVVMNVGFDPKMYFSPEYELTHLGLAASATFRIWRGLEAGVQLRGGINDNVEGLFTEDTRYTGDLGGDIMVRYLVTACRFYFGVQTVFGYDYFFDSRNTTERDSYMSLAIGIPVGLNFEESIAVYVMPAVELGMRNATDTGIWGHLISGSVALGMAINLGGPSLVLEVAPRIDDFDNLALTTGIKAYAGLAFSF
jgi:hypothetical protein